MKVLVVGGGSGGHVTPAAAVINELGKLDDSLEVRFWCDKGFSDRARGIIERTEPEVKFQTVVAGKLRRYSHLSALGHLKLPKTILLNLRDLFLVGVGFLQSLFRLIFWRPKVIFAKGGFVCLPVGLAARVLGVPLVIHDSDAHPGLTNRILAKWARKIATGAPLDNYNYPLDKSEYVGIPIAAEFSRFSAKQQAAAKQVWGMDSKRPLVVVTGGGLGAKRINDAVVDVVDDLLQVSQVILVTGQDQYDHVIKGLGKKTRAGLRVESFVSEGVAGLLGAADIVVARAGATSILELAALAKPVILIPNTQLTGGHQVKNAEVYVKKAAASVIDEDELTDNPAVIVTEVKDLLGDMGKMKAMSRAIAEFARPDAAARVAKMVIGVAKESKRSI